MSSSDGAPTQRNQPLSPLWSALIVFLYAAFLVWIVYVRSRPPQPPVPPGMSLHGS